MGLRERVAALEKMAGPARRVPYSLIEGAPSPTDHPEGTWFYPTLPDEPRTPEEEADYSGVGAPEGEAGGEPAAGS